MLLKDFLILNQDKAFTLHELKHIYNNLYLSTDHMKLQKKKEILI